MLKVHVLYEHSSTIKPHGSSYIRILLPLTYSTNTKYFSVTKGTSYASADIVIVERTWKPHITLSAAQELVAKVRKDCGCLVYTIDDNLLDIKSQLIFNNSLTHQQLMVVRYFAREADGIIVSTDYLKERFRHLNKKIFVVPNALDERLLVAGKIERNTSDRKRRVIGYMGTHTHDADLMMIVQALRKIIRKNTDHLELQLIGCIADSSVIDSFKGLPIKVLDVGNNGDYQNFMRWMSQTVEWDLAIAPLESNSFTRCKSDIKFLDYSALGIAGIYSDVASYNNTVCHLETGYLAANNVEAWVEAFECLLGNDPLRTQIATYAREYVLSNRTLKYCAQNWQQAIFSIVN